MASPPNVGPAPHSYTAYILAGFREARPDLDLDRALTPAGFAPSDWPRRCASPDSTRPS